MCNVASFRKVSAKKVVQYWVKKVIGEGVNEHGELEVPGLVPRTNSIVLERRFLSIELDDREDDHVHEMTQEVQNETQAFVNVFSIISLKKSYQIHYW